MATTKTKTPQLEKAPAKGMAKSTPEPWRGALTRDQTELAELAGDIILNGGDTDDVMLVLAGLLRHQYRRKVNVYYENSPSEDQGAIRYANTWRDGEFKKLARYWPEELPSPEDPKPTVIADMIRVNYRARLRGEFEEFMAKQSGLEDVFVLTDILNTYNCMHAELGEAFELALERAQAYVKVPPKHFKRVEKFIDLLENDVKEAA